ncbi:MAG: DUF2079 domain-containing protein, partial [Planctomycetes bacterium]|nr:DUF2079 domain-containing protein [Planctomycetota bacterium]
MASDSDSGGCGVSAPGGLADAAVRRAHAIRIALGVVGLALVACSLVLFNPAGFPKRFGDLFTTVRTVLVVYGAMLALLAAFGPMLVGALPSPPSEPSPRGRRLAGAALLAAMLAYAVGASVFAVLRHNRLNSSAYDLAIQDQVVWNTAHGRFLETSIEVPPGTYQSYLGDHFSPITAIFAPLYWLWDDVRAILIAQSVLLALGALPVYGIARRRLGSHGPALVFALCYLAYPAIGFINRFDFHPEVAVVPLLLFACWAAEARRLVLASLFLALGLLTKEEVGIIVSMYGLCLLLTRKSAAGGFGAAWLTVGIPVSLLALFVVIPHFRGVASDTLDRYSRLGELMNPLAFAQEILIEHPRKLAFVLKVFLPLGFLSLLAPCALIPVLPVLGYNLLSDNPSQSSIYFHYLAPAIPFVFLSAILGAERVQRNWERAFQWLGVAPDLKSQIPDLRPEPGASAKSAGSGQSAVPTPQPPIQNPKSKIQNHAAALYLFIFAALALRLDCPLTKKISFPYHEVYALERRPNAPEFREAAKLIPREASLATTMPFAPHLSHRRNLRLIWPVKNWGIPDVDFAL